MIEFEKEKFLTEEEAAERLGKAPRTLKYWATKGDGPPRLRLPGDVSGTVYYPESKMLAWLMGRVQGEEGA